ncbi:MAG: YecA family protein [Candidatus Dojkabacteria bacterium]
MSKDEIYKLNDIRSLLPSARLSKRRLEKAISEVEGILSPEWIEKELKRKGGPFGKHPIVQGLNGVVNENTLTIAELGTYIETVKEQTNFKSLVTELKSSGQFYDTLYTLALAYRLNGITTSLTFNPTIDGKTPDIEVIFGENQVIVECTQVNFPHYFSSLENLQYKIINFFHKELLLKRKVWNHLAIVFKKEKVSEQSLMKHLKGVASTQDAELVIDEDDFLIKLIPIKEISDEKTYRNYATDNKFDVFGFMETMPGDRNDSSTWELNNATRHCAFFVKYPGDFQTDLENRILKRVNEKYKNYKGVLNDLEFYVFVNLPPANKFGIHNLFDANIVKRLRGQCFADGKDLINGVMITQRRLTEKHHWQMDQALAVNPNTSNPHIRRITEEMQYLDGNCTFYYPLFRAKPQRNDRCPCGSGNKFKKCCGFYEDTIVIRNNL